MSSVRRAEPVPHPEQLLPRSALRLRTTCGVSSSYPHPDAAFTLKATKADPVPAPTEYLESPAVPDTTRCECRDSHPALRPSAIPAARLNRTPPGPIHRSPSRAPAD